MTFKVPSTSNVQLVGISGERVVVQLPNHRMSREEALLHAAWLVVLAEENKGDFDRVLAAVRRT